MKKLAKILSLSLALVMCAVILTACGATADSMKKKYEDAGYKVETATKEDLAEYAEDGEVEWGIIATKKLNIATVICFKDAKDAEAAEKEINGMTTIVPVKVKRDGKVLTIGTTDDALEAK